VLCREGKILAHTIQFSARSRKNPFIVDDAIRFAPHDGAFALIERTMAALHWNDVAHLDMREDERDGRIYIVDFNPRYWATLLGSLTAGVNFPYLACLTALGIEFPVAGFQPINYLTTRAALRALARGRLSGNKTGLPYICNDPGPRLLNLAKRLRHFAIGQNTNHA
jgi:D-aspartate ligase